MIKITLKNIHFLVMLSAISFLMPSVAQEQHKPNNINNCYDKISKAFTSLDARKMTDIYVDGGYYISAGSKKGIIEGKSELLELYTSYFGRLIKHESSADLQFRVVDRLEDTFSINDIGYYIVSIIPPQASGQPAKQHVGKFMITFKKQPDGSWGIWSEANSSAKLKSYLAATPQGELHFDPYYPVSHYQEKQQ